jgi:hypothetical protein
MMPISTILQPTQQPKQETNNRYELSEMIGREDELSGLGEKRDEQKKIHE